MASLAQKESFSSIFLHLLRFCVAPLSPPSFLTKFGAHKRALISAQTQFNQGRTDPELVVVARWTFLDEGSVVGGDVSVMGVFLEHIYFKLNFLLFILQEGKIERRGWRSLHGFYG